MSSFASHDGSGMSPEKIHLLEYVSEMSLELSEMTGGAGFRDLSDAFRRMSDRARGMIHGVRQPEI